MVWRKIWAREWFGEISHSVHTVVWKLRKFTLTLFWQKFRENNVFTKEITKELIWRSIFWWKLILRFPLTLWAWKWRIFTIPLFEIKMIKEKSGLEKNMQLFLSYFGHFYFVRNYELRIKTQDKYYLMLFLSFILFPRVFKCSTFELHLHKLDICSMPSVKC